MPPKKGKKKTTKAAEEATAVEEVAAEETVQEVAEEEAAPEQMEAEAEAEPAEGAEGENLDAMLAEEAPEIAAPMDDDQTQPAIEASKEAVKEEAKEVAKAAKVKFVVRMQPGSEVHVSNIGDASEEDVRAVFEEIGTVDEIRVMKNSDGTNKGFAFVVFRDKEHGPKSIVTLKDKEISGNKIGLRVSDSRTRLYLDNLATNIDKKALMDAIGTDNGEFDLSLLAPITEEGKEPEEGVVNRGFAFVDFFSFKSADQAKLRLDGMQIGDQAVEVSWALPQPINKILYVRQIAEAVTEEKLKELFEVYGTVEKVVIQKDPKGTRKDFGYVHMESPLCASDAIAGLNGTTLEEKTLIVAVARPERGRQPMRGGLRGMLPRGGLLRGGMRGGLIPNMYHAQAAQFGAMAATQAMRAAQLQAQTQALRAQQAEQQLQQMQARMLQQSMQQQQQQRPGLMAGAMAGGAAAGAYAAGGSAYAMQGLMPGGMRGGGAGAGGGAAMRGGRGGPMMGRGGMMGAGGMPAAYGRGGAGAAGLMGRYRPY